MCIAKVVEIGISLQNDQIIKSLGVDETSEWCNNFVLVAKLNGKVMLCFNQTKPNQAPIRPVHRSPTTCDIFPKLTCIHYFKSVDTSFGHYSLKLDENQHI